MNFIRAFSALITAVALASCAPVEALAQEGPVQISLTRTVCFGFCPDYTVTISGDGDVRYDGRRFVNVVGQRTSSIPQAEVQALLTRFDAIGFDQLNDEYRGQMTDLPTTTITLTRNGATQRLVDYGGTNVCMTRDVRALQAEIDRVAGSAQWVLRDGQPVRTPQPEH